MRSFHTPNRSALHVANAAVATSHPLASLAAIEMLRRGGNAVDAAICAAAVLCVVEPAMTGIGGDGFAIVARPGQPLFGLNASGRAPHDISTAWLLDQGITRIDPLSAHAVTVPGVVRGWERLLDSFGTRGFDEVLQPAIDCAENGFVVQPRVGSDWALFEGKLKGQSDGGRHYLSQGAAPRIGSVQHQRALGQTLRRIAREGSRAIYEGEIAEEIVALIRAKGGLMTLDDMAAMAVSEVAPVVAPYRDLGIAELPPNGSGVIAQIILNLLEPFDLQSLDPNGAERLHLEIEAARIAYAIRDAEIADIGHMQVSVDRLIDKAIAGGLSAQIRRDARNEAIPAPDLRTQSDTIYLSCVDRDGMAVSLINSLYMGFGSGLVTEKSGITLQNRGACFSVNLGHPNTIEGGKRPMHTIIPALALEGDRVSHCFGVMGGMYQPAGHAHVVTNMVDFGMDPQEALESPRAFWDANGTIVLEDTLSSNVFEGLARKGHRVGRTAVPLGGGQIIRIDHASGTLIAGSDPRKDGCAMGY